MTTQRNTNKQQKQRQMNPFRLLTIKHMCLKISVSLQTAFAVETHLAERQWLKEQMYTLKLPSL
jgi:hypothetical protein